MRLLLRRKTTILATVLLLFSQADASSLAQCEQSQQEYTKVEAKWSSLYTEESFLHDELTRLENISHDAKIISDVLETASKMIGSDKKLSKTEVATLNMRIPKQRGVLYQDGSFAITGHKAKSLQESQKILKRIMQWSNDGIRQTQGNLSFIHPQTSQLYTKVKMLEEKIANTCTNEMRTQILARAQKETINDQSIAKRFAEREEQRFREVSDRRWSEIERAWIYRYYNTCRFRPCHPPIGVIH